MIFFLLFVIITHHFLFALKNAHFTYFKATVAEEKKEHGTELLFHWVQIMATTRDWLGQSQERKTNASSGSSAWVEAELVPMSSAFPGQEQGAGYNWGANLCLH